MPGDDPDELLQQQQVARIDCRRYFINPPRFMEGNRVEGFVFGSCTYIEGPSQTLSWRLHVRLYKLVIGGIAYRYRYQAGEVYGWSLPGSEDPVFTRSPVRASCTGGTWQTQSALYVSGTSSGYFYPYPARRYSGSEYLTCRF